MSVTASGSRIPRLISGGVPVQPRAHSETRPTGKGPAEEPSTREARTDPEAQSPLAEPGSETLRPADLRETISDTALADIAPSEGAAEGAAEADTDAAVGASPSSSEAVATLLNGTSEPETALTTAPPDSGEPTTGPTEVSPGDDAVETQLAVAPGTEPTEPALPSPHPSPNDLGAATPIGIEAPSEVAGAERTEPAIEAPPDLEPEPTRPAAQLPSAAETADTDLAAPAPLHLVSSTVEVAPAAEAPPAGRPPTGSTRATSASAEETGPSAAVTEGRGISPGLWGALAGALLITFGGLAFLGVALFRKSEAPAPMTSQPLPLESDHREGSGVDSMAGQELGGDAREATGDDMAPEAADPFPEATGDGFQLALPRLSRRARRLPEEQRRRFNLRTKNQALRAYREENFAEAERLYREAMTFNTWDVASVEGLARSTAQQERYPEAIAWAQLAIQRNPRSATAFRVLGDVQRQAGQNVEAAAAYRRGLARDPEDRWLRQRLREIEGE